MQMNDSLLSILLERVCLLRCRAKASLCLKITKRQMEYQLLIATLSINCLIGNVISISELNEYKNRVGRNTFTNYMTGEKLRRSLKQQIWFKLGPNQPKGTEVMTDEYNLGQLPFKNVLNIDSNSNSEESTSPYAGDSANAGIYDDDINTAFVHLTRPDTGIILHHQNPETEDIRSQNLKQYNKRANSDGTRMEDTPNSELQTIGHSIDSIIKTPSKRYFHFVWKGMFGRLQARPLDKKKVVEKNELKRGRYRGSRFRYFDTLASRLLGK